MLLGQMCEFSLIFCRYLIRSFVQHRIERCNLTLTDIIFAAFPLQTRLLLPIRASNEVMRFNKGSQIFNNHGEGPYKSLLLQGC